MICVVEFDALCWMKQSYRSATNSCSDSDIASWPNTWQLFQMSAQVMHNRVMGTVKDSASKLVDFLMRHHGQTVLLTGTISHRNTADTGLRSWLTILHISIINRHAQVLEFPLTQEYQITEAHRESTPVTKTSNPSNTSSLLVLTSFVSDIGLEVSSVGPK